MASRRSFIAGLLAAGLLPKPTWADVGEPIFLSAAKKPVGDYVLCGISTTGKITFELPLPTRGHAAAAHPIRPEAVAFARRPGTYAIVLDCLTGLQKAQLDAPVGRHFYGHGTFSADGQLLFTTENDFEAGRGIVGIWDTCQHYKRIGEFASGGIGPHEIKVMPEGDILVVANGGIETHPETGRTKLNISTMRSNLSYLDFDGRVLTQVALDQEHQRNSIRHLAVSKESTVAFAMQWQGDASKEMALLGLHDRKTDALKLAEEASIRRMNGYLGSVAISEDGTRLAVTSPRAGRLQEFRRGKLYAETELTDVCGVVACGSNFMVTTGAGLITKGTDHQTFSHAISWDNHLVAVPNTTCIV
jgi:hypothetical protein